MKFGVTITGGATPWQIFQQGSDGTASIHLTGEYQLIHLSQELPLQFSEVAHAKTTVKARIALQATGENVIPWTEATVLDESHWEITFPHVPAGGLYRIETYMDYEGWDGLSCTRGDMIHNVGVGDVFVIAGQSNAAGQNNATGATDAASGATMSLRDEHGDIITAIRRAWENARQSIRQPQLDRMVDTNTDMPVTEGESAAG